MKRCLLALAFLALAAPAFAQQGFVHPGGTLLVNPAANTIAADFQEVEGGQADKTVHVICASTVAVIIFLEHRDATNATTIWSQPLAVQAFVTFETMRSLFVMQDQEHLRLRVMGTGVGNTNPVTGTLACTMFIE